VSDQNTNEAETKDKLLHFMCIGREDHMTLIPLLIWYQYSCVCHI
jgi:hypothetical protein